MSEQQAEERELTCALQKMRMGDVLGPVLSADGHVHWVRKPDGRRAHVSEVCVAHDPLTALRHNDEDS